MAGTFSAISHVMQIHVREEKLVPGIVQALVAEDMATEV